MPLHNVGRPYVKGITEALLQTAERVMNDEGYSALTIDAIASEIGTSRPTFYRRFPTIAHLALEVVKRRFGTGTPVDTGSLAADILELQRAEVEMFSSPLLRKNLTGLLEAARHDEELRQRYLWDFIGPRRANVERVILAAVERGEIPAEGLDMSYVCDLLLGPILARALLPVSAPLDERLAQQTTGSALSALGYGRS